MKGNFTFLFGSVPTEVKSKLKLSARIDSNAGNEAFQKFKNITGEDYDFGIVVHCPSSMPNVIDKLFPYDKFIKGAPPNVSIKKMCHNNGFYLSLNFTLFEPKVPPAFLNFSLPHPININLDIQSDKSGEDLIDFSLRGQNPDHDKIISRSYCSIATNLEAKLIVDIPWEAVGEIYDQFKDIMPKKPPVHPALFSNIINSFDMEITLDQHDRLPSTFLDKFWGDQRNIIEDFTKKYYLIWEDLCSEKLNAKNLKDLDELTDALTSKIVEVHIFDKKKGYIFFEIEAPGFHLLSRHINSIKKTVPLAGVISKAAPPPKIFSSAVKRKKKD